VAELTYAEIGATESGELPAGYRHVDLTAELGRGSALMTRATEALMTFQMHRRAGLRPVTSGPRAAVGVTVVCRPGLGPFAMLVPCRIVWAIDEPGQAGFGYGTLPGHPESGEEAFRLNHDPDGVVRFHVRTFSRPARWFSRAAGPLWNVATDATNRRYIATMRRIGR
jgi:uncharacterized protein (UPF0548 family)